MVLLVLKSQRLDFSSEGHVSSASNFEWAQSVWQLSNLRSGVFPDRWLGMSPRRYRGNSATKRAVD